MGMMNLNDTISAFRCCVQIPPDCANCPEQGPGFGIECRKDVKVSVFHWLKAQEPRVMTLEEIQQLFHDGDTAFLLDTIDSPLIWTLYIAYNGRTNCIVLRDDTGDVHVLRMEDYNVAWRCWTSRPTDEQREAVKWE